MLVVMLRIGGRRVCRGLWQGVQSYRNSTFANIMMQNIQEVQIPVPWGHVAGKWWGDRNVQPVIGLHGLEDNANTFVTLAPLLSVPSFLAIDFMGHGLSSNMPAVGAYHFMDFVVFLRRITDHFKWTKLSLIGHSFGSAVAFVYAAMYPDDVDTYVAIDCVRTLLSVEKEEMVKNIRWSLDKCLAIEQRLVFDPPGYTYEEVRELVRTGSKHSPSLESCDILLERGMKKSERDSKYFLSRDPRLKAFFPTALTEEFILACASRIKCRVLSIRANKGFVNGGKPEQVYFHTLDLLQHSENHNVEGSHHVHLNNPENVAPLINKFLNSPGSKL